MHKRKGSKAGPIQTSPIKKKSNENIFQVLETTEDEGAIIVEKESEKNIEEAKKDEPVLMEIGQEDNYIPTLPKQVFIEVLPKYSQNSGGSVTISKAKA